MEAVKSVKSVPAGPTFRVRPPPWLRLPLVKVTVSCELAVGVEDEVETVINMEPEPVTVAGLNEADAPAGSPVTLGVTTPANPSIEETVMV